MKSDFYIYREEILKYDVIPEILEAVKNLTESGNCDKTLRVKYDSWYELDGKRVDLSSDDSAVFEAGIIRRIIGMPLIELDYRSYPIEGGWSLFVSFVCPYAPGKNEESSIYSLFRQSRFQSMFKYYLGDGEILMDANLAQDIEMAAKLISYYVRYYGCDRDDMKYKMEMGSYDYEMDEIDEINEQDLQTTPSCLGDSDDSDDSENVNLKLYEFEFKFLPEIAREALPTESGQKFLCDKDYVIGFRAHLSGYTLPVDKKDIRVVVIGEGLDGVVVWTMPYPEDVPLARYLAFVPDREANKYIIFTLERTYDFDGKGAQWILGEINDHRIFNYGIVEYPFTPEDFVALVMAHIKSKKS